MAVSLRQIVLLAAVFYGLGFTAGAPAEAEDQCKLGEQCVRDDEVAFMQTKSELHSRMVINSPHKARVNKSENSRLDLVDPLAKFDDLQAKVKNIKDSELTQNTTSDPDEPSPPLDNEPPAPPVKEPAELLSTKNCTEYMRKEGCGWTLKWSCPTQPIGSISSAGNDGTTGYACCCTDHWYLHAMLVNRYVLMDVDEVFSDVDPMVPRVAHEFTISGTTGSQVLTHAEGPLSIVGFKPTSPNSGTFEVAAEYGGGSASFVTKAGKVTLTFKNGQIAHSNSTRD
jgi:hypothetical protein